MSYVLRYHHRVSPEVCAESTLAEIVAVSMPDSNRAWTRKKITEIRYAS